MGYWLWVIELVRGEGIGYWLLVIENNGQCSTPKGSRAESENEVAMFNGQ